MPSVPPDQFRGGYCDGGTLIPRTGNQWELRASPNDKLQSVTRVYSTLGKAKAARRRLCRRHGWLKNEWRYWPGDGDTIQMKVGCTTILFDMVRLTDVTQHVWTMANSTQGIVKTRGITMNSVAGGNHVHRRRWPHPRIARLRVFLFPHMQWKRAHTPPRVVVDAAGKQSFDFRGQAFIST